MALVAVPELVGAGEMFRDQEIARHIALGLMLFYFGSR
jgi:hypothetical protein